MTSAELGKLGALIMKWRGAAVSSDEEAMRSTEGTSTLDLEDELAFHVGYSTGYSDALEAAAAALAKLLEGKDVKG